MQNYYVPIASSIFVPLLLGIFFDIYTKTYRFDEKYYKESIVELTKSLNELKNLSISKSNLISELEVKLQESTNKIQDLDVMAKSNLDKLISYENKFKKLSSFVSEMTV